MICTGKFANLSKISCNGLAPYPGWVATLLVTSCYIVWLLEQDSAMYAILDQVQIY